MDEETSVTIAEPKRTGRELAAYCKQVMPHIGGRGNILATHQNLKILLDAQGVELRYNVMKKETEIIIPNKSFTTDNYYNVSSTFIFSLMKEVEMSTDNYTSLLDYLADSHVYNPVESWITSKPWDGESRLNALFETIELTYPEDRPAVEAFISKWMLGAVESICNPSGADMSGILVLQGIQEIGKTWWVRKLVPKDSVPDAVRVGVGIDPSNKDSIEQVVCHWLVEFGELDGVFRKADIAALKAFLTRPNDTFRKSFARRKSEYPRRTAFIASVNDHSYLVDETGNRRFWTIACKRINSYHTIDMQQLWAEIYHKRMVDNMPFTLNDAEKELLKEINLRHQAIDPIRERLQVKYNWDEPPTVWRWLTATEIADEIGITRPEAKDVRKLASHLRSLNNNTSKRSGGKDLLGIPSKIKPYYAGDF